MEPPCVEAFDVLTMNQEQSTRSRRLRWLPGSGPGRLLAAAFALYLVLNIITINRGYIDFGDGNYLYISWRLSQGARLYRDIVSPQPPLHLLVGRVLVGLGEALGGGMLTLALVRLFSIALHLLTAAIVVRVAQALFDDDWTSALAGSLFLFLPIGFFWAKGYQSEPLLIFFLTLGFWGLLWQQPQGRLLAGLCGALALFTNMTAVPYVGLFVVYVLASRRREALHFLVPLLGVGGILLGLFHFLSAGVYIENIFFNQVGTFHRTDPLGYAIRKIIGQGGNVLVAEGGFVLCSVLGAIVYLSQGKLEIRKVAVWYLFWSLGAIIFVSKGGTEDYIFCLAEPMVAVFGAFFLRFFYLGTFSAWMEERASGALPARLTRAAALITLFAVLGVRGAWELVDTLSQGKYENSSAGVQRVLDYVEYYSDPGDPLWAPPFYAFMARRKIPEDASSTFIWYMRYLNHKVFGDPDREGVAMVSRIVEQLDGVTVPVVALNRRPGQLGAAEEIRQAAAKHYTLVDDQIHSRNEDLAIYVTRKKVLPLNRE